MFTSRHYTRLVRSYGLSQEFITPHCPQQNGLVERVIRKLKEQCVQLERTHRLEAWAEMARQVAHEIKNPLTPIQLSAEHLQRVHADQSKPMGPVLDNCVGTILGQVRLLRRIASEF